MSDPSRAELLARAAGCYRRVGLSADAVRCYEGAGEFVAAGRLLEQAGRLSEAARCYEQGNEWAAAADCHLRLDRPADAADCLVRAGDPLTAAWVLAELARQFVRARTLASEARPARRDHERSRPAARRPADDEAASEPEADFAIAREVVLARCDLGLNRADAAAKRLNAVVGRVAELGPSRRRSQVIEWAVVLAEHLSRPDLASLFHAACYNAGFHGSVQRWEEWAIRTYGDAFGVPLNEPETAPPPPRPS